MKTQIAVNSSKLTLTKEKVANLSENEMNNIVGGEEAKTASSTKSDFTCCWCTSTEAAVEA